METVQNFNALSLSYKNSQQQASLFRLSNEVVFEISQRVFFDFDEGCFDALRATCRRAYVILSPIACFRTQIIRPPRISPESMEQVAKLGLPLERLFQQALFKAEKAYHAGYTKADPTIYDPLIRWLERINPDFKKKISTLSIRFTAGGETVRGGLEKPLEIIRLLPHLSSLTISDYGSGGQCKLNDSVLGEIAEKCHRLERVILRECKHFTRAGLESLIKKHAPFLRELDLYQCTGVKLEERKFLQEVSFLCLGSLSLPYNVNKEEILEIVSRAPNLQRLSIHSSSKLSKSDVEEILNKKHLAAFDLTDSLILEPIEFDELKAEFPQTTLLYD